MTTTETQRIRAGRRTVELRRPDKVLFPAEGPGEGGLTKADLAEYHRLLAPYLLPELKGRPLMLERHPEGIAKQPHFMQKDTPDHYPDWVRRAELPKEGGTVVHTVCDNTATLVFLADQACVCLHRWLSRADRPEHPDRLVFDLDPPDDDFEAVREAARRLKDLLDELRLPARLMTTGSRGLHVTVPLDGHLPFDDCRAFARDLAELLASRHPDSLTTEVRKNRRGNRLYLDIQRNAYAQTAVAPWSVRAKEGGPVAAPLPWDRLDDPGLDARSWSLRDVSAVRELAESTPWSGLGRVRSLTAAARRLKRLG
ncbi:ATP-dependent DNA ligase [Streptomyces sp. NA04227]|uniref:non-homologous end-joining DNA ligase n=1 Tax=Streptomyces sp. NA04227 TaxID=2742136 RepID=UPI0015915F1B|nr:non-homologous end-joining DNA ligase [Streptomyces sp. NA04227]QKW06223.1 ATP-dependent DNA ligase [Streptomyces sp. NA04227]